MLPMISILLSFGEESNMDNDHKKWIEDLMNPSPIDVFNYGAKITNAVNEAPKKKQRWKLKNLFKRIKFWRKKK